MQLATYREAKSVCTKSGLFHLKLLTCSTVIGLFHAVKLYVTGFEKSHLRRTIINLLQFINQL